MYTANVLVVDDEKGILDFLQRLLQKRGYQVTTASTGQQAMELMEELVFDLALLDLKLPDSDGLTLLKKLKEVQPLCPAIIITAYSTIRTAVEAIQLGAYDYLDKPFTDIQELYEITEKAMHSASDHPEQAEEQENAPLTGFIVGRSQQMRKIKQIADVVAPKDITVLIQGETGTGKEVLARYIHFASKRADRPFIAVNCGAFTESLLQSELFGHEKGAFTGATSQRQGIFEIADRGTLFLDEIGEASPNVQVKLLRVLETGDFYRVGGKECHHSNIRIIAATNVNLDSTENSKFRKDLLYRLDVARLTLPPLRDRIEDLKLLADYFYRKHTSAQGCLKVSAEAMELMCAYQWPGNIRELSNVIASSLVMARDEEIKTFHLPAKITSSGGSVGEGKDRETGYHLRGKGREEVGQTEQARHWHPREHLQAAGEDSFSIFSQCQDIIAAHYIARYKKEGSLDLPAVLEKIKALEGKTALLIIKEVLAETLGDRQQTAEKLNLNTRSLRYLLKEKRKSTD